MSRAFELENVVKQALEALLPLGVPVKFSPYGYITDFEPPVIWIIPLDSPTEFSGMGEYWRYRFLIMSCIYETEPDKGWVEAHRLLSDAVDYLLRDRTLNYSARDVVILSEVVRGLPGKFGENIYRAGYNIEIRKRYLRRDK